MPNQTDEPTDVETEERKYLKPVAWLGGRDLLANLKYFLLFAAFKGKLDPRDWMTAQVFPPPDKTLETDAWGKAYVAAFNKSYRDVETIEEFWFDYFADSGDGMTAGYALAYLCMSDLQVTLPNGSAPSREHTAAGEIRSRLAKGDKLKQIADDYRDTAPREITRMLYDGANREAIIEFIENSIPGIVSFAEPGAGAGRRSTALPRGAFLFVGGDTSYHVADFAGLGLRFQKTFQWAATDLGIDIEGEAEERRRPIFGIPGNHDYYDMVDGFNRQFRQPLTKEKNYINLPRRGMPPQLQLPTFKRVQMASYVAIKLPFDWWFWGVDSELPRVDLRQQDFFKRSYSENNLAGAEQQQIEHLGHEPTEAERKLLHKRLERYPHGDIWPFPKKLIVATSEPAVVEGRREPEDGKTPQAFRFLDLRRPFLYPNGPLDEDNDVWLKEEELELVDFDCRLDISGDVHHYARYWGSEEFGGHYASIVSGGGGASMSPTQTDYKEVRAQAIYPSKEASTRIINKELFKPWVVIRGGNIWLVGLIIGIIVYFGASFPESHYNFTESLVNTLLSTPDLTNPLGWPGDVWQVLSQWFFQFRAAGAFQVVKLSFLLLVATSAIAVAGAGYARWLFERLTRTHDWVYDKLHNLKFKLKEKHNKPRPENAPTEQDYRRFLRDIEKQVRLPVPRTQWWAFWGLFVGSVLLTAAFWLAEKKTTGTPHLWACVGLTIGVALLLVGTWKYSKGLVDRFKIDTDAKSDKTEREQFEIVRSLAVRPKLDYVPFWGLLILCAGTAGLAFYDYRNMRDTLPNFGHSALILFSIFVVIAASLVAIYYSKWLFDQSYRIKVDAIISYIPATAVTLIAILIFGVAIWSFGRQQGRQIIADILFLFVLLALPVGCILLAVLVGNYAKKIFLRWVLFGCLGIWHGFLQLVVPFLILRVGRWWYVPPIVLGLVLAVRLLSVHLVRRRRLEGIKHLINWQTLLTAWIIYGFAVIAIPLFFHRLPGGGPPDPWPLVGFSIISGLLGSLMSCVWLGWYFAVSLAFNGHANEAGSTARTEDYKHFIRFKVTEQELTGYVIAVDFPHAPYADLSLWQQIKRAISGNPKESGTGASLKPRLVDVFTLRCRPCPVTGKPLPRE